MLSFKNRTIEKHLICNKLGAFFMKKQIKKRVISQRKEKKRNEKKY